MAIPLPSNSTEEVKGTTVNDIELALSDDKEEGEDLLKKEPEPKKEPEKEDEEKEKEEEKEEKELELSEDEEVIEDELEIITPVARKEILKEFPELFKKFPYLEKAMYREQKYTELLPTIEDAQEAIEARDNFKKFESDILSGNISTVLKSVASADKNAFGKIVDKLLPSIAEVDQNAYYHITGNVTKMIIGAMVNEARTRKDEELEKAALSIHQFVFGRSNFEPVSNYGPKEEPKDNKVEEERKAFLQERFDVTVRDLDTKVTNVIKSTITQNIDPKGSMPEYVRKAAIRDAQEDLDNLVAQDNRFTILKNKLWQKAAESNFSTQSVKAIEQAYKNKAKTLLPSVIQKARNTALKGLGKRTTEEKEERKGHLPVGRTASSNSSEDGKKGKEVPRNMKTLDYLMQD